MVSRSLKSFRASNRARRLESAGKGRRQIGTGCSGTGRLEASLRRADRSSGEKSLGKGLAIRRSRAPLGRAEFPSRSRRPSRAGRAVACRASPPHAGGFGSAVLQGWGACRNPPRFRRGRAVRIHCSRNSPWPRSRRLSRRLLCGEHESAELPAWARGVSTGTRSSESGSTLQTSCAMTARVTRLATSRPRCGGGSRGVLPATRRRGRDRLVGQRPACCGDRKGAKPPGEGEARERGMREPAL